MGKGNPNIREISKATQYKPGESGNPNGRPPGSKSFKTILNHYLNKQVNVKNPITVDKSPTELRDIICLRLNDFAVNRRHSEKSLKAIQEIMDRIDGKPIQSVHQTGDMNLTIGESEELKDAKP